MKRLKIFVACFLLNGCFFLGSAWAMIGQQVSETYKREYVAKYQQFELLLGDAMKITVIPREIREERQRRRNYQISAEVVQARLAALRDILEANPNRFAD